MVDGTLSRLNISTIIPDKTKPFVYGKYDEQFAADLKPYIDRLNEARGTVVCREALRMAKRMLDKCQREGDLTGDDVYQDLSYRAVTIAYLKAMVLYIAHGMQWSKEIEKFAEWSLNSDLWCKCHYFGDDMTDEKQKERVVHKRGRQNMLEMLPEQFTEDQVVEVRRRLGLDDDAKNMLRVWVYRKYIQKDNDSGIYRKYLNKKC